MRWRDLDHYVERNIQIRLSWILLFSTICLVASKSRRLSRQNLSSTHLLQKEDFLLRSHFASGGDNQLSFILQKIAPDRRQRPRRLIVAVVVNYAYRDLALNFVCNLIRVGLTNYLVFSLDGSTFEFLASRKVNTFLFTEDGVPHQLGSFSNLRDKEDIFGTPSFVETSRKKSFHVLKLLELGYSVIFSDADVLWVRNPLPQLLQKAADIVIQSDVSSREGITHRNYKLNSGLYFAKCNYRTVVAFRAIVKYSSAIHRSEQKAFNYVLCGGFKSHNAGPGSRVGNNHCIYLPHGTTVSTLALEGFPNGSNTQLWVSTENFTRIHPNIVAIHDNYVIGREEKIRRLKKIGFWLISDGRVMSRKVCVFPLDGRTPASGPKKRTRVRTKRIF